MMKEREKVLQKLYMQYQMLQQHLENMQQQSKVIGTQLIDLMGTIQSLEDLKNVREGTEILIPISSGVYAKARINDTSNLVVNVGADVTVSKSIDETKAVVERQAEELEKIQNQVLTELQRLSVKAAAIEKEMSSLAE